MILRIFCYAIPFLLLFACGSASDASGEPAAEKSQDLFATGSYKAIFEQIESTNDPARIRQLLLDNYGLVADQQTGWMDTLASRQYIALAEKFAGDHPGDTLTALPLYRAAEVHQALGNFTAAADVLERVSEDYPGFSKRGEALFMLAFTHDEHLKDYDTASDLYERFKREYPDNVFADGVDVLINNLGKSSDEMLKDLEQRAQDNVQ